MRNLIICEIRKVFQQKLILAVMIGLLFLNVLLVFREMTEPLDEWGEYTRADVSLFYEEQEGLDNEELLAALDAGAVSNEALEEFLREQIEEVDSYEDYLSGIRGERERLLSSSFFADADSFSARNVEQIAIVYEKLEGTQLQAGQSYDVESVTDTSVTTYLLFAAVLLLGLRIVLAESENGLLNLIRPMKWGRFHTILAKEAAAAVILFFLLLGFYFSNYCVGVVLFGAADMDRLIQSLDGYLSCPYSITAGQYLVLFFAGQYLGFFAAMMFLFFLGVLLKNTVLSGACTALVFVVEEVILQKTDIHSVYSLVRQVNLAAGVDTASFFQNYKTMNLFAYPVSAAACTWIAMACFVLLFGGLSCRMWCAAGEMAFFIFRKRKLPVRRPREYIHTNLFGHECYKLLVMNKGALFLLCLCVVQIVSYKDFSVNFSEIDAYYEQYTEELEGEVTAENYQYLLSIEEEWQGKAQLAEQYAEMALTGEVSDSYASYMQEQAEVSDVERTAYELAVEQYSYLIDRQEQGKTVRYLSETNYRVLFDDEAADVADAVKMIFVILFGLCTVISCEKKSQVERIIHACKNGSRRVNQRKTAAALCYVLTAWALAFLPRLFLVARITGLPHLTWSAPSLMWFPGMPDWVPVWGAILILQLVRIGGGLIAAAVVLWLSARVEHTAITIVVSAAVLLLPALTWYLGMSGQWGILPLVSGNILL